MPESDKQTLGSRSRLAIAAAAALLVANVIVPLLWGDVYPFTSAPMFRDSPRHFCNYRVYSPSGEELPAINWNLQRIYDGNPVGYGVGVQPPPVLEQEFGVVSDEAAVRKHVEQQFGRPDNSRYEFVDVVQEIIGAMNDQQVGVITTNRWRIGRPVSAISETHQRLPRVARRLDAAVQ
jgi:hypothetical protein